MFPVIGCVVQPRHEYVVVMPSSFRARHGDALRDEANAWPVITGSFDANVQFHAFDADLPAIV
jgi:hypothetical protein